MFDKNANLCSKKVQKKIDKQMFGYYNNGISTEHTFPNVRLL